MGIGDIGISLWGECEAQDGMHLGARGFVHAELIDPDTGAALELDDGATGELVLTHLRHHAAPLLRFRAFDRIGLTHIPVGTGNTDRLVRAIEQLRPEAAVLTPSYAAYLAESHDLRGRACGGSSSRASPAAASRPSARGSRTAGARR